MSKDKLSISLILPVYKEKMNLLQAVNRCVDALERDFDTYEIILVDDGNTDDTGRLMDDLAKKNPNISVIHNIINLNVGISIQKALVLSKMENIVHNAVDLPLAPEEIKTILLLHNDFDMLVLERKKHAGYTLWRFFTSFSNRFLIKLFFPLLSRNIGDFNFTQIFKKKNISSIMPLAKSPTFTTPEMILRAKLLGHKVKTHKTNYYARTDGKGAFGKPHDILWALYEILRFRFYLWRQKLKNN